jgi:hypothetical protein
MPINNANNNIIYGVTNGSVAAAGQVGEILKSSISSSTPVTVPNTTPTDILFLDITPGDWDVWASFFGTFTSGANIFGWINTVSATEPDANLISGVTNGSDALTTAAFPVVMQPMNFTVTTRVYLSVFGVYTTGSFSASGTIMARRVR